MAVNERNKAVVERIQAGESQTSLAAEFGVSRQAINAIWNRYKKEGDEVFVLKSKGAKKTRPLTRHQIDFCRDAFQNRTPSDYDLAAPGEGWSVELVQALVKKEFGFHVRVNRTRAHMVRWGWVPPGQDPDALDDYGFDPEFIAYLKSPAAKEMAAKEAEYVRRSEEERAKRPKRGRGRPRKNPPPEEQFDDDEDLTLPGVEEMKKANEEALKKLRPPSPPPPGVRIGKHSKNKSKVTKPKRPKKRIKKRR